jgi:hypothetical protein
MSVSKLVTALIVSMFLMGCQGYTAAKRDGSVIVMAETSSTSATGGNTTTPDPTATTPPDPVTTQPDPTSTQPTTPTVMPKMVLVPPPCYRNTNCEFYLTLDKAYPESIEIDWKTYDSLFKTQPYYTSNLKTGIPSVDYLSAQGHIVFAPGETQKKFYVRNISTDTYNFIIPLQFSNCMYGTRVDMCKDWMK